MCAASAPEQNSVGDIDGNAEGCVFGIADGGRDTVGEADDVGFEDGIFGTSSCMHPVTINE